MGRSSPAMGHFLLTAESTITQRFKAIFSKFFWLTKIVNHLPHRVLTPFWGATCLIENSEILLGFGLDSPKS
jgi:hypothetical protein